MSEAAIIIHEQTYLGTCTLKRRFPSREIYICPECQTVWLEFCSREKNILTRVRNCVKHGGGHFPLGDIEETTIPLIVKQLDIFARLGEISNGNKT